MHMFSWEIAFPLGVVVLAIAVAWGLIRYQTRDRANDAVTEEATRLEYEHPQYYYEHRDRPREKLRPTESKDTRPSAPLR
jgi:hypothetical protein